jgi:hypothetical protein
MPAKNPADLRRFAYAHPLTRARGFLADHFLMLEGGVKLAVSVNK